MTDSWRIRQPGRLAGGGASALGFVSALAALELATMFALSSLVSLNDDRSTTIGFAAAAVAAGALGAQGFRRFPRPPATLAPRVLTMVTFNWILLVAGGALAHLLAGATDSVVVALFEGSAGITTTAMTTLDPETLPRGLHLYRSLSQWLGGLGAIMVGIVVFPLVLGTSESSARIAVRRGHGALLAGRTSGFERAVAIYGGLTMVLVVAFALAGVPSFSALTHGLTVASTGGLSTDPNSLAGLGDGAQWVASVGMLLAGVSIAALWWAAIGDVGALARSTELRFYLGAVALTTLVIGLDGGGAVGAFTLATSAVSTTGAVGSTTPADLGAGAATLVFFVGGIGAMAGSAGGGFGWTRLLQAVGFARRELIQQVHPDAVRVVKVGGRIIPEHSLARTNGYITMFAITAGLGALVVALGDTDLAPASSISLSVAALSTSGLQAVAPVDPASLDDTSLLALGALMLLGRLAISAVVLTVATAALRVSEAAQRMRPNESGR